MTDLSYAELKSENDRLSGLLARIESKHASDSDALEQQVRQFESALQTVPVGVVVADIDGQIIFGNRAIEAMTRHPVIHSPNTDSYEEWVAFHGDGRRLHSHEYPLARVLRDDLPRAEIDVSYQRGDGTRFWMKIIGEPIRDKHGTKIGAAVATIDIDDEVSLRKTQEMLIAELNHRVKNAFSVSQAIVTQTLRSLNVEEAVRRALEQRLYAYAQAHAKLIGTSWDRADLSEVAHEVLIPIAGQRISIEGPAIELPSRTALSLSMVFYELATNAIKYGGLSRENGLVRLAWRLEPEADGARLKIDWIESGGGETQKSGHTGFGTFITHRAVAAETGGVVDSAIGPDGFFWKLDMPIGAA